MELKLNKKIAGFGAIFGITAIILGAFGAHALKKFLSVEQLTSYETGVKYQMYHALFLILISIVPFISKKSKNLIFYFTFVGVLLFSGSIYLLVTKNISGIDFSAFGILTPIGGLLLIVAWGLFLRNCFIQNFQK